MTPRHGLGALLCVGLLVVPVVSLRNGEQHQALSVIAGQELDRVPARPEPSRASRSGRRTVPPTAATEAPTVTTGAPVVLAAAEVAPTTTPAVAAPRPTTTTTRQARRRTTTTTRPAPPPTTTTTRPADDGGSAGGSADNSQTGKASWYRADYHAESPHWCAHRTLAKGTAVRITNTGNGRSATCTVMDRGPYVDGRIIDLSQHTFSQLAHPDDGVISVRITW